MGSKHKRVKRHGLSSLFPQPKFKLGKKSKISLGLDDIALPKKRRGRKKGSKNRGRSRSRSISIH